MAKTTIAAQTPKTLGSLPLAANSADMTWTAASGTGANGNQTPYTGREILLAKNVSTDTARTVTIESAPDASGREGDVTAYSIGFGETAFFDPRSMPDGDWRQDADGMLYFEGSTSDIQFAVLRVGRG